MTELIAACDAHFAWLLGEGQAPGALTQPPGGVDEPATLRWLRRAALVTRAWLIVEDGEAVGLCGYKARPAEGDVEIGYGVAPGRRRRGHAICAVALMIDAARADDEVRVLTAETAVDNVPSQRALERNGFVRTGAREDAEDGALIVWRREV